jgi:hypothetical protein
MPTVAEAPLPSFSEYLQSELHPGLSFPTADAVWGETERDRMCACLLSIWAEVLMRRAAF